MVDRPGVRFVKSTSGRWYVDGLLFPALVAAILLAVLATMGSWWLWPAVALLGVPALAVVVTSPQKSQIRDSGGWHLR